MFPPVLVPQVWPSDTTAGDKTSQSVGQSRSVNDICLPGAIVRMHEYRGKQYSSQYSSMQRLTGLDLQQYTVHRAAGVTDMVQEVQHPILKQFYVTSPLAGFWCATLSDLKSCTHCDWEQLYTLVLERIKSDLSAVKPRIQNALETGMVIETNGKYVSDLRHFTSRRGFVPEPQLKLHSAAFAEYLVEDARALCGEITPNIRSACTILSQVLNAHASLHNKFKSLDIVEIQSDSNDKRAAICLQLDIPKIQQPNHTGPKALYTFAHNIYWLLANGVNIYVSIYLSVYLSISLSLSPSIFLSIYLVIYLFYYLSIYLIKYLSIYLSNYLSTYLIYAKLS